MYKIGFGSDVHRLEKDKPLVLGGVRIESDLGAVGHSDADALLHAITDALLGSLALGDIGSHFSDKDASWKNADSQIFLKEAARMIKEKGFEISNLDSTIHLETPKLRPHIDAMRENIARILEIEVEQISVKAKTGEQVDAVGTRRAVRADAVVLIIKSEARA